MPSQIQPLKLWVQGGDRAPGINPGKVAIVLHELSVPYESILFPLSDIKTPEYLSINPNGRLPALHDPNFGTEGITIWESGAIIEYLIETYDSSHKISFPHTSPSYHHAKQWLYFQTSGQGPSYGQLAWFTLFAPSPNPMAISRYAAEVNRVTLVLENWLKSQSTTKSGEDGGPWLVGNKYSYADISFVQWQNVIALIAQKEDYDVDAYPFVKAWLERIGNRAEVKRALMHPGVAAE